MENCNNYFIKNTNELCESVSVPLSCCNVYISSITNLESLKYFNSISNLKLCALDPIELYCEDVIDTTNIKYLTNLKSLFIENNDHIESIDLSNLKNLQTLFISSCHLLKNITGLNKLENLLDLVIYDVPNLDRTFYSNLVSFVSKKNFNKLILDINSYPMLSEEELKVLKTNNACFSEKIGFRDNYVYTFKMMEEFHKKIMNVYIDVHSKAKDLDSSLYRMYQYVKNINYDESSLNKRNEYVLEGGKFYKFNNRYKSTNSSYKALMKNKAVCEGSVNLLRYLYKLENIDLYPVFCEVNGLSHVAGKAFINGSELYFDPEMDHRLGNNENYMISKKEFIAKHNLLFFRDNFDIIYTSKNKVRE